MWHFVGCLFRHGKHLGLLICHSAEALTCGQFPARCFDVVVHEACEFSQQIHMSQMKMAVAASAVSDI